jgi:hypothetical protein
MYQPIQMPQLDPFSGIKNALTEARQSMRDQDKQRADMLMREKELAQQGEIQRGNLALGNRQQAMREEAANAELKSKRMEVVTQIGQALDAGRPDMARQIASVHGIKLDDVLGPQHGAGDTLMAPGATRQVQHEAPPVGPVQPPTTEYVPGEEQPVKPQARSYRIDGVGYDQEERQLGERAQAARNAGVQRQAFSTLGPEYGDLAASLATGADPKVAAIVSQRYERDTQREAIEAEKVRQRGFAEEQQGRALAQSDLNNQRMAAAIAAGKSAGLGLKAELGERQEESGLDGVTEKVFRNLGFKEIQAQNRKFNDMAAGLAKGNAALDAKTAGSWVKEAQGGTGVISDADMRQFWDRVGGWGIRGQEMVQGALNGQLGDEKRRVVAEAVRELAGRAQYNLGNIKTALRQRLENSAYRDRVNDVMSTYFPEERNRIEDARAIDRARGRTRSNRVSGGGSDRLDRDLAEIE